MLNGPALLRVFLVVVAAAVLTGLVQHYWILETPPPEPTEAAARPTVRPPAVRRPDPPAAAPEPAPARETPAPAEVPPLAPASEPPRQSSLFAPAPNPAPSPDSHAAPEAAPDAAPAEVSQGEAAITEARVVDLVDLNTATLTQLNTLKGGGAIGRAIIQSRPYDSIDQLLSKRVLSRTTYQRIKDQVTVR